MRSRGYRVSDNLPPPDVIALRPFLPAKDFATSLRFYRDLGLQTSRLSDSLAAVQLGSFSFLLQEFDAPNFAANFMMQLLVDDLAAWWARIDALDLVRSYGVQAPRAPTRQPWGQIVAYVFDPAGVLWHIAQARP